MLLDVVEGDAVLGVDDRGRRPSHGRERGPERVVRLHEVPGVAAAPRRLEQPLPGVQGRRVVTAGVADIPESPQHGKAAGCVPETIDELPRAGVRRLHFRRCGAVRGDERGAEGDARVEGDRQRLRRFRQLGEQRERLLEEPDRRPVGRTPHRLCPRLPQVSHRLVPQATSRGVMGEPLDLLVQAARLP